MLPQPTSYDKEDNRKKSKVFRTTTETLAITAETGNYFGRAAAWTAYLVVGTVVFLGLPFLLRGSAKRTKSESSHEDKLANGKNGLVPRDSGNSEKQMALAVRKGAGQGRAITSYRTPTSTPTFTSSTGRALLALSEKEQDLSHLELTHHSSHSRTLRRKVLENHWPQPSDEFQINAFTSGYQRESAVCGLDDGGYLVVWYTTEAPDGNSVEIMAQRYDASNNKTGDEFIVNFNTVNNQDTPTLARLNDGRVVIGWSSFGANEYDIVARIYDPITDQLDAEFPVNTYTTSRQTSSKVTATSDGGFFFVWTSNNQNGDPTTGIFGKRFKANAQPMGSEIHINSYTTSAQYDPVVAGLQDNRVAVSWFNSGFETRFVNLKFFNGANDNITNDFIVMPDTGDLRYTPALSASPLGGVVAVYEQESLLGGIACRAFDEYGTPVNDEFLVNDFTAGTQTNPAIAHLNSAGDYVVVYQSDGKSGQPAGVHFNIYGQRFNATHYKVGLEFQVSVNTTFSHIDAAIAATSNGGFIVTYTSQGTGPTAQDGDADGIFGRYYPSSDNNTPLPSDPTILIRTVLIVGGTTGAVCIYISPFCCIVCTGAGVFYYKKDKNNNKDKNDTPTPTGEIELSTILETPGSFQISKEMQPYLLHPTGELSFIGSGGEATVYKVMCRIDELQKEIEVAFKALTIISQDDVKDFESKAKMMLELKHPNIIRVYGIHLRLNKIGFIMEYMRMGSLRDAITGGIPLPWFAAKWKIIRGTASALKDLHNRNIVHRDIKPENILLFKKEEKDVKEIHGKLADFGLSKVVDPNDDRSQTMGIGSYKYMPPELMGVVLSRADDMGKYSPKKVDIYCIFLTWVVLINEKLPYDESKLGSSYPAAVGKGEIYEDLSATKCPTSFFKLCERGRHNDPRKRPDINNIVQELEKMESEAAGFTPI